MKRPILIATIGFIIGIFWGLYFELVSFFLLLIFIYSITYFLKLKQIKIFRFLKLFITRNTIIIFFIFFIISNFYIRYLENDYKRIYNTLEKIKCVGTVISEKEEKDYSYQYKVKIEKINNKKVKNKIFYITVKKNKNYNLKYAEKISFDGKYIKPEVQRNYKGFDYSMYLKSKGIYGTINVERNIYTIKKNNLCIISIFSNKIKNLIIHNTDKVFSEKTKGIFLGILIGYDEFITEDIKSNFSNSGLSHLLAVSGMHVSYVILAITLILKIFKIPKLKRKILSCLLLFFYLNLINFTPSVTRAVVMSIIALLQSVLHRKQDTATTISFSSLIILFFNPYKILNIGFILSYAGTIGIIIFIKKSINNKEEKLKKRLVNTLKSILAVTISAYILILPINIYYFNTISLTFVISNIIAGVIIGPITIIGITIIIVSFINIKVSFIIVKLFYNVLLILLLKTTEVIASLPISNIYVKTPNFLCLIIYYIIILVIIITLIIKKSNRAYLNKKLRFIISDLKNNLHKILLLIFFISVIFFIYNKIPKKLKINFIDVGQGDCTLITTPYNKNILIDSGGNENYDIGKNILFPYLLDKGITKIDYIIISHFDTDHCNGFNYVMQNIKVKNIIISKQPEISENYQTIIDIAKKRRINIFYINKGDEKLIEKNLKIYFLWPDINNFVTENSLNNNSIVCKIVYKNFSCMFTGDIEKNAEEKILKQYEKSNILKSTVLKIAHHGSKSSTTEELLKKINPKIALIGVGKNNKFGHPNIEIIERLNRFRS